MTDVMLNVIADLLEYPTKWIKRKREIEEIVINLTSSRAYLLKEFLEEVSNYNELDLEEIYVKTFDNNDYITLNISYYITGEEKNRVNLPKRGLLLVWLKERVKDYMREDLPDYLPTLLRYLGSKYDEEVKKLIQNPLKTLQSRLKEHKSVFYPLITLAILELYGGEVNG